LNVSVRQRRVLVGLVVVVLLVVAFVSAYHRGAKRRSPMATPSTSFDATPLDVDPSARFLVIGGGGEPDSSEVQLERDVALVRTTLVGPSITLFAGGPDRFGVREDAPPHDATFRESISSLFLLRARPGRIRTPSFRPDGSSTYENVTLALDRLLAGTGAPLLLVFATHGEGADDPLDAYALLWGNDGLFVRDLVDLFASPNVVRPTRTVVGSCHGGAFAAVPDGERRDPSGAALHCGFYATTADRLASGCDGNPDRSAHRSYLRSFFSALGRAQPGRRVSMLEAHVAAASALESFDVPFTSSEHVVREAFASRNLAIAGSVAEAVPESSIVAAALASRLRIASETEARAALESVQEVLEGLEEEIVDAESSRDAAWNRLRVAMLERFPWLEDAYAAGWDARVARERAEIEPLLLRSDLAEALAILDERVASASMEADDARVREAMLTRLVDAYEFPRILGAIRASAPEVAARFDALRACERYVPEVAR